MDDLFQKNIAFLKQRFETGQTYVKILDSVIRITGNAFPIKEDLKHFSFKWNQENKVWEIPRYVLEEKDLANTIIGPIQPIETTKAHILEEIETIENEFLHRLLENLLINGPYQDSFFIAPGAKTIHHNYAGGLAEHTLYVLLGSKALAQVYTQLPINNDLLKTGAILHDIGKVDCYALSSDGINTTKKMELFDHIVLGISIINRVGQPLVQSPADEDLLDQVVHIIASHHALPEWGSPKEPATNEAWIIHVNDLVSARLAKTK